MTGKIPSFVSYFDPYSQEHNSFENSQKLGGSTQALIWIVSIIAGICTLGVGGLAVFRALVERVSKNIAKEQQGASKKADQVFQHTINHTNTPFQELCNSIKTDYPDVEIDSYKTVQDLEEKEGILDRIMEDKKGHLLRMYFKAGGDISKGSAKVATALDVLMKGFKAENTADQEMIFDSVEAGVETSKIALTSFLENCKDERLLGRVFFRIKSRQQKECFSDLQKEIIKGIGSIRDEKQQELNQWMDSFHEGSFIVDNGFKEKLYKFIEDGAVPSEEKRLWFLNACESKDRGLIEGLLVKIRKKKDSNNRFGHFQVQNKGLSLFADQITKKLKIPLEKASEQLRVLSDDIHKTPKGQPIKEETKRGMEALIDIGRVPSEKNIQKWRQNSTPEDKKWLDELFLNTLMLENIQKPRGNPLNKQTKRLIGNLVKAGAKPAPKAVQCLLRFCSSDHELAWFNSLFSSIQSKARQENLPLHNAARNKNLAELESVLKTGVDISQKDEAGHTALDTLFFSPLLEETSDIRRITRSTQNMIDFLVKKGERPSTEALECLITLAPMGCSDWLMTVIDEVVDKDDLSRIAHAILGNRFLGLSIDFLFPKGLDVNATNKNGKTLLYIAVEEGNAALVEDLLKRGADRNLKATLPEKVERSPLDAAKLKVEELSRPGSASKKPVMEQIVRMLEDNS